jgi:hypothetical protein
VARAAWQKQQQQEQQQEASDKRMRSREAQGLDISVYLSSFVYL